MFRGESIFLGVVGFFVDLREVMERGYLVIFAILCVFRRKFSI